MVVDMLEVMMLIFVVFFYYIFYVKIVLYLKFFQVFFYVFIGEVNVWVSNGFNQKFVIFFVERLFGRFLKSLISMNFEFVGFFLNYICVIFFFFLVSGQWCN